jgi:TPR repeat/LytR cell envelope-related transcriptional attenuator/Tetratricopeptide repeat
MRTAVTLKRLSILCAGAMLFACADLSDRFAVPEQRVARSADDAYLLGRSYHLAHRYEDALKSYRAALAVDPRHVNARNGLATIYAERRAFAQAIPIWRGLTEKITFSSGPGSAYLFGNLGYAYFLDGEYENAVVALEKACLLDPMNHNAWYHLGESLQKLGQEQRAQDMFRQAEALRGHDLRSDYAAAGGTTVPAIEAAVKAPERPVEEWAATAIVKRPDGLLELRRVQRPHVSSGSAVAAVPIEARPAPQAPARQVPDAVVVAQPVPAPATPPRAPAPAALTPQSALLEIRNGNGVTGMAKSLSHQISDPGLKVVRLTNEKSFNVRQTRVEYQTGFRPAAERLAQRIGNATVVEVDNCKRTDLRLVIGRDIARPTFALRPLAEPGGAPVLADNTSVAR